MTGPLVTTDWLARHLDHSVLRLADVRWYLGEPERGRQAYLESHIPGAFYVDLETDEVEMEGDVQAEVQYKEEEEEKEAEEQP